MSVSIIDVARCAKVAPSTVSNVLTQKKYVSPEIRDRVNKVCQELGYKPNYFATSLVKKETKLIGLFLTVDKDQFDSFLSSLIKGVGTELSKYGYHVVLFFNKEEDCEEAPLYTSSGMMDGAIVLSPLQKDFRIDELIKEDVPYVLIGKPSMEYLGSHYVDADNYYTTYQITKKLIDCGHERILFLNSDKSLTISEDRYKAYKQAFIDSNLEVDESRVVNIDIKQLDLSNIYTYFDNIDFTACITESDVVALEVYKCLKKYPEYEIGENFALAALGGDSVSKRIKPSLTTAIVDYIELGKKSSNLILSLLSGEQNISKDLLIKSKIIYTKSCDFVLKN